MSVHSTHRPTHLKKKLKKKTQQCRKLIFFLVRWSIFFGNCLALNFLAWSNLIKMLFENHTFMQYIYNNNDT